MQCKSPTLINQQWTMKTLLCVAVLALVASTIASPLPHRAAINNHHLLDNNVRELLQLLVTNIQEAKTFAEEEDEYEYPSLNNDQLSEAASDIDVTDLLQLLQRQAKEKAMAQSPYPRERIIRFN